jgi:hypothetical protein
MQPAFICYYDVARENNDEKERFIRYKSFVDGRVLVPLFRYP